MVDENIVICCESEGVSLGISESTLVSVQQSCDVTVCDADVVYINIERHFQFMSNKLK